MPENNRTMDTALESFLGIAPSNWMMAPSERFVILGILQALKPQLVLELGCAQGGLTEQLSKYSDKVITVDLDPRVAQVTRDLENVTAFNMTTAEAFARLREQRLVFDLTVIDADHSRAGVARDLEQALQCSRCIVMHDTYYPPCRAGMLDVLSSREVYYDLELVPGGLQTDGLWGGLGIVLPQVRRQAQAYVTPRRSTFTALASEWERREQIHSLQNLPQTFMVMLKHMLRG